MTWTAGRADLSAGGADRVRACPPPLPVAAGARARLSATPRWSPGYRRTFFEG